MLNLRPHFTGARFVDHDTIERRTHWQASGIIENKPKKRKNLLNSLNPTTSLFFDFI